MAFVLSLFLASTVSSLQATGSITGCIVDAMHKPLPGATLVATGESVRGTTEANTLGCYNLKGLPPGKYRVTARFPGSTNVTQDNVTVPARDGAPRDFTLKTSGRCECVIVRGSLADVMKQSDAVLHVRITGPLEGQREGSEYYQHAATVLHSIKFPGLAAPATVPLLQDQAAGSPVPYDVDQEMVVFLRSFEKRGFVIVNGAIELNRDNKEKAALVFAVRDGQIVETPSDFSKYVGTTLDSFLYELRGSK